MSKAQTSLLGFFDQDLKKKVVGIKSTKRNFAGKHEKTSKRISNKKKNSVVQQFLQVGQKEIPSNCPICGMMYTRGIEEDEELHKSFHKQYLNAFIIPVSN